MEADTGGRSVGTFDVYREYAEPEHSVVRCTVVSAIAIAIAVVVVVWCDCDRQTATDTPHRRVSVILVVPPEPA